MTRKRMYDVIKQRLEDYQLECDDACMDVVDVAVNEALQYVCSFAQDLSIEMVSSEMYSEAMVAGTIINKIKTLLGE